MQVTIIVWKFHVWYLGDHDDREYCEGNVSGEDDEAFELPPPPHNGSRGGAQRGKLKNSMNSSVNVRFIFNST